MSWFHVDLTVSPPDQSLPPLPLHKPTYEKLPLPLPLSLSHANPALAPFLLAEGLSSMETLLTNIQVIMEINRRWQFSFRTSQSGSGFWGLSGASEGGGAECSMSGQTKPDGEEGVKGGAGQRERCQTDSAEAAELRAADQRWDRRAPLAFTTETLRAALHLNFLPVSIQKRLKKEKKAKRRLQEALDFESRRRQQVERALKHSDLLAGNLKSDLLTSEVATPR